MLIPPGHSSPRVQQFTLRLTLKLGQRRLLLSHHQRIRLLLRIHLPVQRRPRQSYLKLQQLKPLHLHHRVIVTKAPSGVSGGASAKRKAENGNTDFYGFNYIRYSTTTRNTASRYRCLDVCYIWLDTLRWHLAYRSGCCRSCRLTIVSSFFILF